jgi:hypothetical protein
MNHFISTYGVRAQPLATTTFDLGLYEYILNVSNKIHVAAGTYLKMGSYSCISISEPAVSDAHHSAVSIPLQKDITKGNKPNDAFVKSYSPISLFLRI